MIPEIQTIEKSTDKFLLLVKLAKSANTRNLIGTVLLKDCNVTERVRGLLNRPNTEPAMRNRLEQALLRLQKQVRKSHLANAASHAAVG